MSKITLHVVVFLLTAPLMAQDLATVTSSNKPNFYVPLAQNASPITMSDTEITNAKTPAQMQIAILDQSAAIHNATVQGLPSAPSATALPDLSGAALSFTQAAGGSGSSPVSVTPPVFSALQETQQHDQDAVNYILQQRQQVNGQPGLPLDYNVPSNVTINNNQDVTEGAGLYDTSLGIMTLIQNDDLSDAKQMLDIYNVPSGMYGGMTIRAYENSSNNGAFAPFNSINTSYFFDETRADGNYVEPQNPNDVWTDYSAHTGPNAWLVLADAQYVAAAEKAGTSPSQLQNYINLASGIGDAMILLQDSAAHGAVRYGPHYGPNPPDYPFNQINSENDISAYAAFNALYTLTGNAKYQQAASKILGWLQTASVYNPITGQTQKGMMDSNTGLLYDGLNYNSTLNRWEIQTGTNSTGQLVPLEATDSGGTWAISALGPAKIDSLFGAGAAYKMYMTLRAQTGRTANIESNGYVNVTPSGASGALDGFDFSNLYSPSQDLISPEWSAGGAFAIQQLLTYYSPGRGAIGGQGAGLLTLNQVWGLQHDESTLKQFMLQTPLVYALGPGLTGSRQGATGFGWNAPPSSVQAMASVYSVLTKDPLAWARTAPPFS